MAQKSHNNRLIKAPLFEIGLKGYAWGKQAVQLAVAAQEASRRYDVQVIFDPQHVDIAACAAATSDLLIFAQHMDPVTPGAGCGFVLAEALRDAGAHGTLLNHAEHRMTLHALHLAIQRARACDLLTLVCADSPEQAAAIAHLAPDMILAEPPELIGTGQGVSQQSAAVIAHTQAMVHAVNPDIILFNSAGIRSDRDVFDLIAQGAQGTGSTSGILKAPDPVDMLTRMIQAVREAWDKSNTA